jgi:hypothetical protein
METRGRRRDTVRKIQNHNTNQYLRYYQLWKSRRATKGARHLPRGILRVKGTDSKRAEGFSNARIIFSKLSQAKNSYVYIKIKD